MWWSQRKTAISVALCISTRKNDWEERNQCAARMYQQQELLKFPLTTAIGGLMNYIVTADPKHFQPMNVNFSLIPPLEGKKIRNKKEKNAIIAQRALDDLDAFIQQELKAE